MSDDLVERLEVATISEQLDAAASRLAVEEWFKSYNHEKAAADVERFSAAIRSEILGTAVALADPYRIRAEKAEAEATQFAEWAKAWHSTCQTVATILDLPEPEANSLAGLVRSKFEKAEEDNKRLREALGDIHNPIGAMRRDAEAQGGRLDGAMANVLANDPHYLRGIARAALERNDG